MVEIDLDEIEARAAAAADAEFIAQARQDIPVLVARVRELEAVEGIALAEVERAIVAVSAARTAMTEFAAVAIPGGV